MSSPLARDFNSLAVHAGQEPDATSGAVIPPVHFSSTFVQDGIGNLRDGYDYGRAGNPTRTALERQLAAIEGADFGLSFASGLAAEDALLRGVLRPGDEILLGNDAYGGTYRLISKILVPWGVTVRVADLSDPSAVEQALSETTPKLVWVETPSNPLLRVTDIAALARSAHEVGALLVVDNTFATPALQRPLALGADVVVHSATKYLGGHSDVVGGAIMTSDADIHEKTKFLQFAAGAVSGPLDAWLTTRGIKTLGIRMERHSTNAQRIAEALAGDPRVTAVHYPGLPSHPGHDIAAGQMSGFGGIVSLDLATGAQARAFSEATKLFTLAESLGGVESLLNYPDAMTHASVRGTELAVPETLVRLSVGIEGVDDLLADIDQALEAAT